MRRIAARVLSIVAVLVSCSVAVGAGSAHASPAFYSGLWPRAVDFQPSGGWTAGSLPASGYDAATIGIQWSAANPGPGTYSWTPYDNELSALHTAGKKAVLIFWNLQRESSCSTKGQGIPDYVWTDLGASNEFCDTAGHTELPNYFSPAYISDWQRFMSAAASHFASLADASDIAYIRGGYAKGGETQPCDGQGFGSDQTCATRYETWLGGASLTTLLTDYGAFLTSRATDEGRYFSFTSIVLPVDVWDGGATKPGCTYPGSGTCVFHNAWIYALVLLSPQYVPGSNANPGNTGNVQGLDAAIAAHISARHFEFQEVAAANSSAASITDANAAWQFSSRIPGAASLEFYRGDWTHGYSGMAVFTSLES